MRNGLVVRVRLPRMLDDEEFGDINVFDRIALAPVQSSITIDIPGLGGNRPARSANLQAKFFPVTYAAHPRGIKTKQVANRSHLELNIVHLFENNPPQEETAVHWTLVTTLESKNISQLSKW